MYNNQTDVFRDWLLYIKTSCWFFYIKLLTPPLHRALEEGQFRKKKFAFESFFWIPIENLGILGAVKVHFHPPFVKFSQIFGIF